MATTRVRLNSGEIQSYLDGGHGVDALLHQAASQVLSAAQSAAPVESGEYQASLHVEEDRTDRLVVRVVADAPHALVVEARDGVLARAIDAAR